MNDKKGPSGFLIGLIIGGAIGALVSSKKGRQIIKDIADYGLDYVGKTMEMGNLETIFEEDEDEMYAGEMDEDNEPAEKETKHKSSTESSEPKIYRPKESSKRRFFHIKKK